MLEPDTTHVVIDGSSPLAAARDAGLTTVKVMVSDDQGANSEELLESALVANIHRQDLAELDEARALQRLLAIHGSQTALAKRLHRSQRWVSQRLALLGLTPELQARVGEEPIALLRAVGSKPPEQQEAVLATLKQERARKEAEKQERKRRKQRKTDAPAAQGAEKADDYYGVIENGGTAGPPTTSPGGEAADDLAGTGEGAPTLPVQATAAEATAGEGEQKQLMRFPYDDGASAAMYLIQRMPPEEFDTMLDRLIKHRESQAASAR